MATSQSKASKAPKTNSKTNTSHKTSRNITLMLITVSFLFSFCTLPWATYYALSLTVLQEEKNCTTHLFYIFGIICLYCLTNAKIFVYLIFNKLYRKVFTSYFRKFILRFKFQINISLLKIDLYLIKANHTILCYCCYMDYQ